MAECVVYEDTPFAEYLAEIGSEEETIRQPDPIPSEADRTENKFSIYTNFLQKSYELISSLKKTLSTALPPHEENQFGERFKYILCTSHLLNEELSIRFYDNKRPSIFNVADAGQYLGRLSRQNFEILLSVTIGLTITILTLFQADYAKLLATFTITLLTSFWLYRHMRRKAMKTLYDSALYLVEILVYNCQVFDIKANRALIMIQEIELVSRGYRLSMPLSPIARIEQASKTRRCTSLRETLHAIFRDAYLGYRHAIKIIQPEVSQTNLAIMYNMYNIVPTPDDYWNLDDVEDPTSLEILRICFQKMHAKRREYLCHLLALDAMTPGRNPNRADYEHHWATVNEHLNELGSTIGQYLDTIISASSNEPYTIPSPRQDVLSRHSPFAADRKLRAFLTKLASIEQHIRGVQAKLYICNEDARKIFDNEEFIDETEAEQLMKQYMSISTDFTYMVEDWEEGKRALTNMTEPTDSEAERQSLEADASSQEQDSSTDHDESSSERTLIDWSQLDEPLDVPELYFEAESEPDPPKKKLTREERISVQKAKREEEAKVKAGRIETLRMVHELKDVLTRRRTKNTETSNLPPPEQPQPLSFDNQTEASIPIAMH